MKKLLSFLLLLLLTLSPVSAAGPSPRAYLPIVYAPPPSFNVWTASPATKIQPTTVPGTQRTITLEGALGSYEAYQIIVSAKAALSGVNFSAGSLSDGAGHTLAASNLTFFRQAFIDYAGTSENEPGNQPVPANSPTHDSRIPDPLIPFIDPYTPGRAVGAPFNVGAGLNQPVWLDVAIPANTVPGTYTGQITVSASQYTPVVIPLTLTVWNLTLPDMNVITTYFGMHSEPGLLNYHSGTAACSGGSCWLDWTARPRLIVKRYEELLHQHRASTWPNFIPSPEGGTCTPPTSWTAYDAALTPYLNGTYWSDGIPSPWYRTPFSPGVDWGIEANCTQAQYTTLAQSWAAHLKTKGWFNKALVYAYDEPPSSIFARIAQHSSWMQAGDAGWKARILDTVTPRPSNVATLNPALGIYCVALSGYDKWGSDSSVPSAQIPYGRSNWPTLFAQGIQLWFYESNAQSAPYPTFATNTLLGYEPRIMLWGAWYEQASGFLLWDTTAWTINNPWGPNVEWGKSGDGVLMYPGNHDGLLAPIGSPAGVAIDGPIPSYRLKMVRAGLQDWALFKLAEQHGLNAYARTQLAAVYGQLGGCEWQGCPAKVNGSFFWKTDEALMQQARHNIALAILSH